MEEQRLLLNSVFGDSSESEEENHPLRFDSTGISKSRIWERVREVNGLWLCSDFLSPEHQSSFLSAIGCEGWFTDTSHNQAMRFGDLPNWAVELASLIRDEVWCGEELCGDSSKEEECPLPSNLLWREPFFDQLIVNVYQPGEGICAHVDLLRFDDGIAIISLESPCVMHFTKVEREARNDECGELEEESYSVPLLLSPGSLVLMSGEARYEWKHAINRKPGFQVWGGKEVEQKRRTSVTLRKLLRTQAQNTFNS